MLQALIVASGLVVPALIAFGSSARRRLGIIQEEAKTLDLMPPDSLARKVMYAQLNESVDEYQRHRATSSRNNQRFWLLFSAQVAYLAVVVFVAVAADLSLARELLPAKSDRTVVVRWAGGVAVIAMIVVTWIISSVSGKSATLASRQGAKRPHGRVAVPRRKPTKRRSRA